MTPARRTAADRLLRMMPPAGPVVTGSGRRDRTLAASTVAGSIRPTAPAAGGSPRASILTHLPLVPSFAPRSFAPRLLDVFAALADSGGQPRESAQPTTEPLRQRRLAFIEDSMEDFRMIARVFRDCGTLVHWTSAEAALEAFETGEVDLAELDALIVDLHLPGIDGVELVRVARDLPGGTAPVICMLTSSTSQGDLERARRAGADGYLVKPQGVAGLRALPAQVAEIAAAR